MKKLWTVLWLLWGSHAIADQVQSFGAYQVHYNTFESAFLTPDIANQYGFTRSKGQALLNVAVTTQAAGQLPQSQRMIVTGTVTNLLGQIVPLSFKTIDEGDAVYYIAAFTKTDDEILKFQVHARPNANAAPMTVNFQRHFYVDK